MNHPPQALAYSPVSGPSTFIISGPTPCPSTRIAQQGHNPPWCPDSKGNSGSYAGSPASSGPEQRLPLTELSPWLSPGCVCTRKAPFLDTLSLCSLGWGASIMPSKQLHRQLPRPLNQEEAQGKQGRLHKVRVLQGPGTQAMTDKKGAPGLEPETY